MTKTLIHELPERANDLLHRVRHILEAVDSPEGRRLLAQAKIDRGSKPRMVLTGQFSTGKSKLVEALTDGVVVPGSAADILTYDVREYDWDGSVTLVDTPGVQSGLRDHDQLADEAIGRADLVLFVITVAMFDDPARDFLRHLTNDLRLFGSMIVVITQSGKQGAAEGIRQDEVRRALGTMDLSLPVVEVDSVFYLRSLESGPRAELLRERSGIDRLRHQINVISRNKGQLAQLHQPIRLVRQLCDEAKPLFVSDERSQAALGLLASQRRAITQRRHQINVAFTRIESDFKSRCLVDIRGFVDSVSSLPSDEAQAAAVVDEAQERLLGALERHAQRLAEDIGALAERELAALEEELADIPNSNRMQRVLRAEGRPELERPNRFSFRPGRTTRPDEHGGGINWERINKLLTDGQKWWGAGEGIRSSSGTIGHELVKKIGHSFGHKFKPWEAVKTANTIGKFLKIGGFVIQIGAAGYEVWRTEREEREALRESERLHSAFVTELMGYADRISSDARTKLGEIIDPPMTDFLTDIEAAQDEILQADDTRSQALAELRAISAEADALLSDAE